MVVPVGIDFTEVVGAARHGDPTDLVHPRERMAATTARGGRLLVDVVDIPGLHTFDPAPSLTGREEAIVPWRGDEGPPRVGPVLALHAKTPPTYGWTVLRLRRPR